MWVHVLHIWPRATSVVVRRAIILVQPGGEGQRPGRGSGGTLEAPQLGSGAETRKPMQKLLKLCKNSILKTSTGEGCKFLTGGRRSLHVTVLLVI